MAIYIINVYIINISKLFNLRLMRFYGKKVRPFALEFGNFLDEKYRNLILKEATIIFINNFAFKPELESKIKYNFLMEVQSGTKIISTKPYAPVKGTTINDRQANGKFFYIFFCMLNIPPIHVDLEFASIVHVTELRPCTNSVSWTSADVPYYLHVIDYGKVCYIRF